MANKFFILLLFFTMSAKAQQYSFGANRFLLTDSIAEFKNDTSSAHFFMLNNSIDSSVVKIKNSTYTIYFNNKKLDSIIINGQNKIKIIDNKTIILNTNCRDNIILNSGKGSISKYVCDSLFYSISYNADSTIKEFYCIDKSAKHNLCFFNISSSIYKYKLFFRPNNAIDIPGNYITPNYNFSNQIILTQFYIHKRGLKNSNLIGFDVYYGPDYNKNSKPLLQLINKRGKVIN